MSLIGKKKIDENVSLSSTPKTTKNKADNLSDEASSKDKKHQITPGERFKAETNKLMDLVDISDLIFKGESYVDVEISGIKVAKIKTLKTKDGNALDKSKEEDPSDLNVVTQTLLYKLYSIYDKDGSTTILPTNFDEKIKFLDELSQDVMVKIYTATIQHDLAVERIINGAGNLSLEEQIKK